MSAVEPGSFEPGPGTLPLELLAHRGPVLLGDQARESLVAWPAAWEGKAEGLSGAERDDLRTVRGEVNVLAEEREILKTCLRGRRHAQTAHSPQTDVRPVQGDPTVPSW